MIHLTMFLLQTINAIAFMHIISSSGAEGVKGQVVRFIFGQLVTPRLDLMV